MKRLIYLCGLSCLLIACGSGTGAEPESAFTEAERTAQQTAYDEMMEAHDRVMPRMGEIFQLNRSLETQLAGDTTAVEVREMIERLATAEDGMMVWMSEIDPLDSLRTGLNHAEIMAYIQEESAEIQAVEAEMNRSIEAGMKLVEVE